MIKVAFLTPTWRRAQFLKNSLLCVQSQRFDGLNQPVEARWFVLDDSDEINHDLANFRATETQKVAVDYHWLPQKTLLGWKRNQLNKIALDWGADYLCSIDDDDWYGADYAQAMIQVIQNSPDGLAGSSEDFYLDLNTGRILRFPPCGAWHSCHGVLCYSRAAAEQSAYLNDRNAQEEPAFLNGRKVAQLANISQYHLAVAHAGNTVSKAGFCSNPQAVTDLTLEHIPMLAESRIFYRQLLAQTVQVEAAKSASRPSLAPPIHIQFKSKPKS